MKNFFVFLWEISKIVIIAMLIVVPVRYFVFQPFFVRGQSMEPNFQNGDYLIVDEISYRLREPQRGEVIVFEYPLNPSQRFIKRIIGLPGETVQIHDGKVSVYGFDGTVQTLNELGYLTNSSLTFGDMDVRLGDGQYFVLGDNRVASSDSRRWGILPQENIIGRVLLRAWPVTALAAVGAPSY